MVKPYESVSGIPVLALQICPGLVSRVIHYVYRIYRRKSSKLHLKLVLMIASFSAYACLLFYHELQTQISHETPNCTSGNVGGIKSEAPSLRFGIPRDMQGIFSEGRAVIESPDNTDWCCLYLTPCTVSNGKGQKQARNNHQFATSSLPPSLATVWWLISQRKRIDHLPCVDDTWDCGQDVGTPSVVPLNAASTRFCATLKSS